MNRDPLTMTDAEVVKAHKLALKKQRQWAEAVAILEWHLMIRSHLKKQEKINRLEDMKSAVKALEDEIRQSA